MSEPLRGVVVTHSHMAAALVEAVEAIAGDTGPFISISNIGATRESLCEDIADAVGEDGAPVELAVHGAADKLRRAADGSPSEAGARRDGGCPGSV